jgi:hypothetical protein
MTPLVAEFMQLFDGYQDAYGIYNLTGDKTEAGKQIGKAASKKGKLTKELWDLHLRGQQGLGVIPINEESNVKFGAIDIDEYPLDLVAINKNIVDHNLPLVLVRTKSGGAHLFVFLEDWAPAKIVQSKLREFASFLGYGSAEIFPKQTKILVERGDIGQWINMPYFDANKTLRYALGDDSRSLLPEDFIAYAKSKKTTADKLAEYKCAPKEHLQGGPPCLQHVLSSGGFPEGSRNNGLFNLGVYALKANPDTWEKDIETLNNQHMDPPLSPNEVLGVVKSLKKKDYTYTCNTPPIKSHCNKAVCRMCKFGIGQGDLGFPVFGTLTKIETKPPVWFLEVEGGGRLQLTTDDLQSPIKFQLRCMETLNIMPIILKRDNWAQMVSKLLESVHVVGVPKEATPAGMLFQYLEEFLTSRVQASKADEMLLGKPWSNDKYYYFRLRDFHKYLERNKFTALANNQINVYLKEFGKAEHKFMNLGGRGVNVYMIPMELFTKQVMPFDVPDMETKEEY